MTIKEIQQEILRMKKEQDVCILAHAYQGQEILEVADYMGDSYGLSVQAAKSDCSGVIMCGVRFMAEGAKILNPDKLVLIPDMKAGCSLEDSCPPKEFAEFKAQHPDHMVITYINCSAEIKALSDIIVAGILNLVTIPS